MEPPASLLLVHGAGSGPWVYRDWPAAFAPLYVSAVDLHESLEIDRASMADYARRVVAAARELPPPVALCGWSMGGLAVLMAASELRPHSLILLEPSAPAEVQGVHPELPLAEGAFDPEAEYGTFPDGVAARPESSLARAERKRGISVPSLPCRSLVIATSDFPEERGRAVAELYGSTLLELPDLEHFDLVLHPAVRGAVAGYLGI